MQDNSVVRADARPLGRRTVLAAAAWSVPAVSVVAAAPAYAATVGCPVGGYTYTLNWATLRPTATAITGGFQVSVVPTNGTAAQKAANTIILKVTNSFEGGATAYTGNMALSSGNIGGTGAKGLGFLQNTPTNTVAANRRNYRQEITFDFGASPITDLSFKITDIDSLDGDFIDQVEISPTMTGAPQHSTGTRVTGSGTTASPWHSTNPNSDQDNEDGTRGNITVTSSSVSSFVLTYWNSQTSFRVDNSQAIYLTNFTFKKACPTV